MVLRAVRSEAVRGDASLINIFSAWGMVFVMALYTFPYVFTFVANSLDVIPSELEEASVDPRRSCVADRSAHHAAAGRCRRCSPDSWSRSCSR